MTDERAVTIAERPDMVHFEREENLLDVAEKRTKFMDQLISMSLGRLRAGDVNNMDGKPYINSDGCYKIARLWGVNIHYTGLPQKFEAKDKRGEYYFYVMAATVSLKGGESVDVVGNCSSRDPFFAKAHGEWRQVEDIDQLDVMQKAQTACDRKGIAKLLGLNNITWDDIQKYSGLSQAQCSSFSFKKPAQEAKPPARTPQKPPANTPPPSGPEPKAAEAPAAVTTGPVTQTDPITELRNACLETIKAATNKDGSAYKGKKIMDVVRELSGGKVSLGLCNESELNLILDKLNS